MLKTCSNIPAYDRVPRGEIWKQNVKHSGKLGGAYDSAKNHKHQRQKRQSVTAKVRIGLVRSSQVRLS